MAHLEPPSLILNHQIKASGFLSFIGVSAEDEKSGENKFGHTIMTSWTTGSFKRFLLFSNKP